MHPQAFLDLAADLRQHVGEEHYRTSVSRSYQAAFLYARQFLEVGNVRISKGPTGHQEVFEALLNAPVSEMKQAARDLDGLRHQRIKADYCLTWGGGTRDTAESWYQIARGIFGVIQQAGIGPQKQEILDAARRHLETRRGGRS